MRITPLKISWFLTGLILAALGCSSTESPTVIPAAVESKSLPTPEAAKLPTAKPPVPEATKLPSTKPAPPPTPKSPESSLSPEARDFLREARTMANLALAYEYGAFTKGWDGLAHQAAAAGLALEPRNNAERVYQNLRGVHGFVDMYLEVDTKMRADPSPGYLNLLKKIKPDIDKAAQEALQSIDAAEKGGGLR